MEVGGGRNKEQRREGKEKEGKERKGKGDRDLGRRGRAISLPRTKFLRIRAWQKGKRLEDKSIDHRIRYASSSFLWDPACILNMLYTYMDTIATAVAFHIRISNGLECHCIVMMQRSAAIWLVTICSV
jgi:hypothetical protein